MRFYDFVKESFGREQAKEQDLSLFGLTSVLLSDVRHSAALVNRADSAYARRQFIRTLFTLIEGFVFEIKSWVLANHEAKLSVPEIAILSENSYELNEKAEPTPRVNYPRLPVNLVFAFSIFARVNGGEIPIDKTSADWSAFKTAHDVRNRLTHPKTMADLEVTDKEIEKASEADSWFRSLVVQAMVITITRRMLDMSGNSDVSQEEFKELYVEHMRDTLEAIGDFLPKDR